MSSRAPHTEKEDAEQNRKSYTGSCEERVLGEVRVAHSAELWHLPQGTRNDLNSRRPR